MNDVLLDGPLRGKAKWQEFAAKLQKALADEYNLDGVTVVLRELSPEEVEREGGESLTFNQDSQRFEFALGPAEKLPAAWKVADRIEQFLDLESDSAGA
jgi:hypothetical protein